MWQPITVIRVVPLLMGLVIPACGGAPAAPPITAAPVGSSPSASASASAPASASIAPSASEPAATAGLEARAIATLALGGGPDMPTEAFGSLWVVAVDGPIMNDGTVPAVHRIDPATNEVIASVEIAGRVCQGIGASPEAMWVCGPDGLARIDPATNEIAATVELPAALVVSRIAYGAGSVWAFSTSGVTPDSVVRIDPATNAVTATIPLGPTAGAMAFGFDALWVSSPTDDLLLRIDPEMSAVEEWATEVEGANWIAVGDDALWVSLLGEKGSQADEGEATVVRIDPETGEVAASVAMGGSVEVSGGIAAAADAIWVRAPDPFLVRIDPATNEIVDRIDTPTGYGGGGDVSVAFGSVWVTTENGEVIRLEP